MTSLRRIQIGLCGLVVVLLAALACGRPRSFEESEEPSSTLGALAAGTKQVAVFDLTGGVPESMQTGGLFPLPARHTFVGLIRSFERIRADDDVTTVFVKLGQGNMGWAQAAEIGRLLEKLDQAGKPVVCHAHTLSNSTAWLFLRGCKRVWLSPAGDANVVGIAAQLLYLKGALDKLHIETDFLSMGRYKSGGEPLTRTGPSEPSRENLVNTLRSIRDAWLDSAAKHSKAKNIRDTLENGPFTPQQAKERGLIDAVGFESEALEDAKQRGSTERTEQRFGLGASAEQGSGIAELIRLLSGADDRSGGRPHIAVVPAVGAITTEAGGPFDASGITSAAMNKTLRRLRKDDSVKAVVLRIESPGGSPLASDLIWHEVMKMRDEKPVIVSVGDMAASGGYYIACAANKIVAEPTSIVGSIGVFGGKIVFGPALEQLGINVVTFPASPEPGAKARAAYMSPLTTWDDATRERMRNQMRHIYELFLKRVAEGRKMPLDKVRANAEGAIFSGTQGRANGLVDELGGLYKALELARKAASLDNDAPVVVEGASESFIEQLLLGENAGAAEVAAALSKHQAERAALLSVIPEDVLPFVQSVSPLMHGEKAVVALPMILSVR